MNLDLSTLCLELIRQSIWRCLVFTHFTFVVRSKKELYHDSKFTIPVLIFGQCLSFKQPLHEQWVC